MNPSTHLHRATREKSVDGQTDHDHAGHTHASISYDASVSISSFNSVLGWPAWQRVLAVLPLLLLMWLAVWWASAEVAPW